MRQLLFICLLVFSGLAVQAQQVTALDILKKAASAYSDCHSYMDEGTASFKPLGVPFGAGGMQTKFRTAFVSPDRFRFEVYGTGKIGNWIIWTNGDALRTSGPNELFETSTSVDSSLIQLGFPSFGSSLTVPQLLLAKTLRANDLLSLISNPIITGEEKTDGHPAIRIEGTVWSDSITIWIDRAQYLILKLARRTNIGNGNRGQEITIQYKPKLNSNIAPELLLAPPAPAPMVRGANVMPANLPLVAAPNLKRFGSSLNASQTGSGKNGTRTTADEDVIRVDTDLVVSSVLVVDRAGKIVTGLSKDDFVVKEDDKPQEVASLSRGDSKDVARSIVLIIDYSGSQLPYIRTSIESAKMLVDKLNPKDRMAIVTDDVRLLADFTADKELLKSRLEGLKTSALAGYIGASEQFDAMFATLNEMFSNDDVRPIVIFQTDGDELEGLKGNVPTTPFWLPRKFSFEEILAAAERTKVTIYPVISGMRYAGVPDGELSERASIDWKNRQLANLEMLRARGLPLPRQDQQDPSPEFLSRYATQWRTRQMAMLQLARLTGAWPEFLEQPAQADEIYTRILTDIDRRFVIGYYPTNRARDGKRRKVSVEVRNHPDYLVWGQKSYFAREN